MNIKLDSKKEETKFVILICYEDWIKKKSKKSEWTVFSSCFAFFFIVVEYDLIQ